MKANYLSSNNTSNLYNRLSSVKKLRFNFNITNQSIDFSNRIDLPKSHTLRKRIQEFAIILFLILCINPLSQVYGVNKTWIGTSGGNWSAAFNWSPSGVPLSGDNVTLIQGQTVVVNISNAVCLNLNLSPSANGTATLQFNSGSQLTTSGIVTLGGGNSNRLGNINMTSGGTLSCNGFALANAGANTFTAGLGTVQLNATNTLPATIFTNFNNLILASGTTTLGTNINLSGNWTNNGGILAPSVNSVTFNGSGTQAINGSVTSQIFYSIIINKAGQTLNIGGSITGLTLNGNLTVTAGIFNPNGALLTGNGTNTLSVTGTLIVDKSTFAGNYTSWETRALNALSTIIYSNINPTIDAGMTYQNLQFSGSGTANTSGALSIQGDLSNLGGGILNFGVNNVILSGAVATNNIAGFITSGIVSMTKTAGTVTLQGNINGGGLTINGTGATLNLGIGLSHTFSGNWTRTAGTLNGGSSLLNIGGSVSGAGGTFIANTGTVDWYANGAQTIAGVIYNNLTLSGSGIKTITGTTVNGILSMEDAATASVAPTYGTNATLQYNTSSAYVAGAEWLNTFAATGGVIIANIGTISLNAAKIFNISIPLTINNGASLNTNAANYQITLGGDFHNNGGIFIANASPIIITNTMASQSIDGFTTTGAISITKSAGIVTFYGNINGSSLTISNGGTVNLGNGLVHTVNTLTLGTTGQPNGSWGGTGSAALYINTIYFAAATGIINVNSSICIAGNWLGAVSSDWNTDLNWCGGIPNSATNVIILSGVPNQPTINSAAICNNLTINAGASLIISGANTLTINGNWVNNGSFTANSSTVIYNAGASQTGAVVSYNNLTITGSGIKTFATTPIVNGILSMEGTANVSVTTGVITYGANATLQYNTASDRTASAEEWITPFAASGGVIIANTGTITLNAAKVFNLSIPLTINSGAFLNTSAVNNYQITLGGDFHNNGGTLIANASPIVIANTLANQSIDGFTTTGLVSMIKTAGSATFLGNINGGGLTINGTGGTLNLGNGLTHTFNGDWTRTAGTLNGGSSIFRIGGNIIGTGGIFNANTSTMEYYALANQNVASLTYYNLKTSGSGIKTMNGVITVNNDLTIGSDTKLADFCYQITGNANGILTIENNATLELGTLGAGTFTQFPTGYSTAHINLDDGSTVNYYGETNGQIITTAPLSYGNIDVEGLGIKTPDAGNLIINGNLTIGSTIRFHLNNPVVSIAGNFIYQSGNVNFSATSLFSVAGDFYWNNPLTTGFVANNGTICFNGASRQNIGGLAEIPFYNLKIAQIDNNTLTLDMKIAVFGDLALSNGIIITDSTNIVTMKDLSTTTIGAKNSYINGPMNYELKIKDAYRTLKFPIGKDANWEPIELTLKHDNTDTYNYFAEVRNENAALRNWTLPPTVDKISQDRIWHINRSKPSPYKEAPTEGLSGNQIIKIYYSAEDHVTDPNHLTICKSTYLVPNSWIDIGGLATGAPTGTITSQSSPSAFNSFSDFVLGNLDGGSNPLPIEMVSFSVSCNNNEALLNWSTASETNNDYFTIERSLNGINWESMGNTPGMGNSNKLAKYVYTDPNPLDATSYYRLKQTDFDGKFDYSEIVKFKPCSNKTEDVTVYPNPTNGIFHINYVGELRDFKQIKIYDDMGKLIFNINTYEPNIDITNQPNGIYVIQVITETENYINKIIKNR